MLIRSRWDADIVDVCRDDRCTKEHLHVSHPIDEGDLLGPGWMSIALTRRENQPPRPARPATMRIAPWKIPDHVGLKQAVLQQLSRFVCKTSTQIFVDVVATFGSTTPRSIQRVLIEMADQWDGRSYDCDHVLGVVPPSWSMAFRKRGQAQRMGYIRADSPLLWDRDGYSRMIESLDDGSE